MTGAVLKMVLVPRVCLRTFALQLIILRYTVWKEQRARTPYCLFVFFFGVYMCACMCIICVCEHVHVYVRTFICLFNCLFCTFGLFKRSYRQETKQTRDLLSASGTLPADAISSPILKFVLCFFYIKRKNMRLSELGGYIWEKLWVGKSITSICFMIF